MRIPMWRSSVVLTRQDSVAYPQKVGGWRAASVAQVGVASQL